MTQIHPYPSNDDRHEAFTELTVALGPLASPRLIANLIHEKVRKREGHEDPI